MSRARNKGRFNGMWTLRTPRRQRAETKELPFEGISLSSAGSLNETVSMCRFGRRPRHACNGYGPGWRVSTGGECSKLPSGNQWLILVELLGVRTYKDSNGTCNHRIASETLVWSLERWGTTPRDVEVIRPGVDTLIVVFSDVRCMERVPNLGENEEEGGWIWNRRECMSGVTAVLRGFSTTCQTRVSCDPLLVHACHCMRVGL
jgi:hypothetical protein